MLNKCWNFKPTCKLIGSLLVSQLVGLTNTNPHNTKLAGIIFMRQLAPPVIANDSTIKGSHCHAHSELTRYNNAHSTHNHETNNYSPPFHIRATALHTWPRAMRKHGVVFLFKIDDQEKSKSLFKVSVTRHNACTTNLDWDIVNQKIKIKCMFYVPQNRLC